MSSLSSDVSKSFSSLSKSSAVSKSDITYPPSGLGAGGGFGSGDSLLGFRGHPYRNKIVDLPYLAGLSKRFNMGFNAPPRSMAAKKKGGKKR
jgi:hypothetical protein